MTKELQKHFRVDSDTGEVLAAENDFAAIADELVAAARGQGIELTGPNGLLTGLTRQVLQTALEVEMADHLGYDKHDPVGRNGGNSRNGSTPKTVRTGVGEVTIQIPRDRAGTFAPAVVPKYARRLAGFDEAVVSLYAKGMTTGDIVNHLADVYGDEVSRDLVSKVTDQILNDMVDWQSRPLDAVYPVILIDAIVLKVRSGQVGNRPVYVAMGITVEGHRDVLGMWIGPTGGEGAKQWMNMLTELRNRGIQDVIIVCCDGLKGLPESITATWPLATVQTCVVHLVRNSLRFASKKYWKEITGGLKEIYQAKTVAEAEARFDDFAQTWEATYPAMIQSWRNSWVEFVPFLDFRACRRMPCPGWSAGRGLGELSMARNYRPVLRDQVFLLPPDMRDWLPEDHLVWFVLDVIETIDVSAFERARRRGGVGAAGYDPRMLLGLLVYSYCRGVRSSRQIERQCHTDIAFKVLCAGDIPDHATIARFRAVSENAFVGLFAQVLMIAARAGLARFGTIAIDGTKIPANASIDANRGRDWFDQHAVQVAAGIVEEATSADATEDARTAREDGEPDGDRVPAVLADRSGRAERIRRASAELAEQHRRLDADDDVRTKGARSRLEASRAGRPVRGRIPDGPLRLAEARAHLERELRDHQAKLDRRAALIAVGKKPMGSPPVATEEHSRIIRARRVVAAAVAAADTAHETKGPTKNLPKTVANITDPDSRVMPTRRGFVQGYNAQVAVTSDHVIAAVDVTRSPNDMGSFVPMMTAAVTAASTLHRATESPEHLLGVVLADAGYCSNSNLDCPGPDRLIALGKSREQAAAALRSPTSGPPPTDATTREAMAHRLRTPEGATAYKRRGATVEPSIGTLKTILGRFSRRGLAAAHSELNLAAAAYNIRKVHTATT